ncbi:hypothetical protein CEXT_227231 [Caerostris extrusa]|uniref:Secreted protein n=1 Tax=Caerostris extrusa TaxID=172846 RepID=A0AAV4NAP1_CAEEX|nr:hypothetical protein CEXT_227231 [Caerostris extrusa]
MSPVVSNLSPTTRLVLSRCRCLGLLVAGRWAFIFLNIAIHSHIIPQTSAETRFKQRTEPPQHTPPNCEIPAFLCSNFDGNSHETSSPSVPSNPRRINGGVSA